MSFEDKPMEPTGTKQDRVSDRERVEKMCTRNLNLNLIKIIKFNCAECSTAWEGSLKV